jgi:hypothetical protein
VKNLLHLVEDQHIHERLKGAMRSFNGIILGAGTGRSASAVAVGGEKP